MKSISQYNNVEKARALHQLFPNAVKGFITFAKAHAQNTIDHKDELSKNWGSQPFNF